MGKGKCVMLMDRFTKEILSIPTSMEKEDIIREMDRLIKDILRIIK